MSATSDRPTGEDDVEWYANNAGCSVQTWQWVGKLIAIANEIGELPPADRPAALRAMKNVRSMTKQLLDEGRNYTDGHWHPDHRAGCLHCAASQAVSS